MRRWKYSGWFAGVTAVALVLGLAAYAGWLYPADHPHSRTGRKIVAMLASSQPQDRKEGAWLAADVGATWVANRLQAAEENPDVREAFIYSLGRLGVGLEHCLQAARSDSSGYVRCAAWLAIARIDAEAARDALVSPGPDSAWDELGRIQAMLEIGDASAIADLVALARDGESGQRMVAVRTIGRVIYPALESVGRWPLDARLIPGELIPADVLTTILKRCEGLDLVRLMREWRSSETAARGLRRNVLKITNARDRLARLLFGSPAGRPAASQPADGRP